MFSVRENVVREKQFADHTPESNVKGSHHVVSTLTDDSSLFLLHRLREKENTGVVARHRWKFWQR